LSTDSSTVGQTQKSKEDFLTYDQIKTSKDDIIDYGGPVSVIKTERKVINLFDYPSGTVTYIVNGKSSTDVNYIKQLLAGEGKDIEAISIGKPDEKGKRVIKIDYNLR
jgi:ribosomal protein S4E